MLTDPRRGPLPIAYQLDDDRMLCSGNCLGELAAAALADAGQHVGDVHPWTVDLYPGDPAVCCSGCGATILPAPPFEPDSDD
ncbi:hypothetical protein [Nonomuraea salmonea]|uniref:Uncharacterized protein n=1 Tax=Nonomuraea salmonea TaxID=46181 RepID=A0ABV5P3B5_9ACTN